jgi:ribokinase
MSEIVVIGSLNMDLSIRVPRIPLPGETISGENLVTSAGGKGANQAAACANLGSQVTMIGAVGQDDFGRRMKEGLRKVGINVSFIQENPGVPSGTAMIMVDAAGENVIVLSAGANSYVVIDRNAEELIRNAKILLLQLEIPTGIVFRSIEIANDAGVPVLLNPAPAIALPNEIYSRVDYLIPNEIEASILSGVEVKDIASAEKAAGILLDRGVKTVIITLGANGAFLASGNNRHAIPAMKINPVDTTGAGDAFIGGFATAIVEGKPLEEALHYATAAGALAATKAGAQSSLPSRQELEQFVKLRV